MSSRKLHFLMIGAATALVVAGCGGGSSNQSSPATTPPPPTVTGESFTNWSKVDVFPQPEDGKPIDMPLDANGALTVSFDGDDNPSAYADLLPTT